ncbi:MAG: hypothetical protein K0S26_1857 [Bacteroidota bacterium]|jgi:hypothetical protein|nr:hypothetical protein [Bacteroidota bacterium]
MQIPGTAIELRAYYTWMGDDGIGRTCVKPNVDITLEDAISNTRAVTALYVDRKFPLLIDSRSVKSMSYEARHHFAVRDRETKTCAFGIIIGSAISRVLGNFYLGINKPSVPTRLFDKETDAIQWLKQFVKNGN